MLLGFGRLTGKLAGWHEHYRHCLGCFVSRFGLVLGWFWLALKWLWYGDIVWLSNLVDLGNQIAFFDCITNVCIQLGNLA